MTQNLQRRDTSSTAMQRASQHGRSLLMVPNNFAEAVRMAEFLAASTMVPKDYRGNPANIVIAMDYALQLRLPPMTAMKGIAVINGRTTVWGDLMLAIVLAHPDCVKIHERPILDDAGKIVAAECSVQRRGFDLRAETFSIEMAKTAKLWGKEGPWTQYPPRMLKMRARSWALRDLFADALCGLQCSEEVRDHHLGQQDSGPIEETSRVYIDKGADKYVVDAAYSEQTDNPNLPSVEEERPAKVDETPKSALPSVLECIANAGNLSELSACKARFTELTVDERVQAIDTGVAKKMELADQAAQRAAHDAQQASESES